MAESTFESLQREAGGRASLSEGAEQAKGDMPSLSVVPGNRHFTSAFLPAVFVFANSRHCRRSAGVWKVRKFAVALTVSASGDGSMITARKGTGAAIVWFRNDLRISDNEALLKAWQSSQAVVPLYAVDPCFYGTTYTFGFLKTGELRVQFIMESVADLRDSLRQRGLGLIVRQGFCA